MTIVAPASDQLVILDYISWETYERLLAERQGRSGPRFTYDRGRLEIMVLSIQHERLKSILTTLVDLLVLELKLDAESLGSMTFQRPDLHQGFEPDACFYFKHAADIRGQTEIDLFVDPPPDLLIEVDITHMSLNRQPLFAAVGVPEVWRYKADRVQILRLAGDTYVESAHSEIFPALTSHVLTRFVQESESLSKWLWMERVLTWIRAQG